MTSSLVFSEHCNAYHPAAPVSSSMASGGAVPHLPPELLAHVCEFIDCKRTLASFIRCSHQFYGVAGPYLYRHIDLLSTANYDDFYSLEPRDDVSRHIEGLARAFLREPRLGRHVRHLAIRMPLIKDALRGSKPLDPECAKAVRHLMQNDQGITARAIKALHHTRTPLAPSPSSSERSGSDWETTDESTSEDRSSLEPPGPAVLPETEAERWLYFASANRVLRGNMLLTILLSRLERLETLDLEMPRMGWSTGFLDAVLRKSISAVAPFNETPFLANLRKVCFGHMSPRERGRYWAGHLHLPQLTHLYLHRVFGIRASLECAPRSLNITHLELRDCRIPPASLRRLLAGPKVLKTFIYVLGEIQNRSEFMQPISYRSIRQALEPQKDCLEQIWIDYPHDYSFDENSTIHTAPMDSFSGFPKLKHLHIAGTYLFGFVFTDDLDTRRLVHALPEQIETVHLSHADEDEETVKGVLWVLKAKKQGRFEKLRELKLDAASTWLAENYHELSSAINYGENECNMKVRLFDNCSGSRIQDALEWIDNAYRRQLGTHFPRSESRWGFNEEVDWPERVSGCMQRPGYNEVWYSEKSPGQLESVRVLPGLPCQ
jgi:hypothetical protein